MVSVTAEEDDLWSTLPESVLANQNEQIHYLQNRLIDMKEQADELNKEGGQLVFVSTSYVQKVTRHF